MCSAERGVYRVGMYHADVAITYNDQEAYDLLDFLFRDMKSAGSPVAIRRFDVVMAGKPTKMSLWEQDKQIYFGECKHTLAHLLINEVIYEGIVGNHHHLALHAGAVAAGDKGILLPGKSGSGKSSLTAWLVGQGLAYLTDELVLLAGEGTIHPFTRPLAVKSPVGDMLIDMFDLNREHLLTGPKGTMIPHLLLNDSGIKKKPRLDLIIFPTFVMGMASSLEKISHAQCCLKLLDTFVNARNLANHGVSELAALTRSADAYQLRYGGFDDLPRLLSPLLPSGVRLG